MIIRNDNILEVNVIDEDASNFVSRLAATGVTFTTEQTVSLSRFVTNLKANNIWNSLKALYPLIGSNATGASSYQLNLKSTSFTGTINGGMTLNNFGIVGDGTSAYFETGLVANNELNFNSQHYMVYTSASNNGLESLVGACDGEGYNGVSLFLNYESLCLSPLNEGVFGGQMSPTTGFGFVLLSRLGNSKSLFMNGTLHETVTSTPTNYTSMRSVWFLGRNADDGRPFPAANTLCTNQIRVASIGAGLTALQAASYYTAVEDFCSSFNKSVIV